MPHAKLYEISQTRFTYFHIKTSYFFHRRLQYLKQSDLKLSAMADFDAPESEDQQVSTPVLESTSS